MANPSALPQLSDIHLNHLIGQIKELPYFDGNPSELSRYIARVEYLLQLYPGHTQAIWRHHTTCLGHPIPRKH